MWSLGHVRNSRHQAIQVHHHLGGCNASSNDFLFVVKGYEKRARHYCERSTIPITTLLKAIHSTQYLHPIFRASLERQVLYQAACIQKRSFLDIGGFQRGIRINGLFICRILAQTLLACISAALPSPSRPAHLKICRVPSRLEAHARMEYRKTDDSDANHGSFEDHICDFLIGQLAMKPLTQLANSKAASRKDGHSC